MHPTRPFRIGYQNAVLTAIALFLGLGLAERQATTPASGGAAMAQQEPPDAGGLGNALEQRKQIIAELRTVNGRLERIEARLAGKLEVKVVDMPPLKLPPEARAKPADRAEPKPADSK